MKLIVTYKNAAGSIADVGASQVSPDDFEGAGYGSDLSVTDLDLTLDLTWQREVRQWIASGGVPAPYADTGAQSVLSQNLMAQFTADDATKIQAAVASSSQFWLLWSALQAQKDPMEVGNARFMAGWSALVAVLGADRMAAIAAALDVTVA